ncbi:MAG: hypothetical protein AB7G25_02240 [Sphingomonadaceae bacterium]
MIQGVSGRRGNDLPGGCYIVALDAATGEEVWRFQTLARPVRSATRSARLNMSRSLRAVARRSTVSSRRSHPNCRFRPARNRCSYSRCRLTPQKADDRRLRRDQLGSHTTGRLSTVLSVRPRTRT